MYIIVDFIYSGNYAMFHILEHLCSNASCKSAEGATPGTLIPCNSMNLKPANSLVLMPKTSMPFEVLGDPQLLHI